MFPPDNSPPPTLTEQASLFFSRLAGGTGDAPKAGWPDFHAAIVKFSTSHTPDEPHLDQMRDILARGIPLMRAAMGWEEPVAGGKAGVPTDVDRDRGAQWRFVMAFAGFEMIARAVLHRGTGGFWASHPKVSSTSYRGSIRSVSRWLGSLCF